MNLYIHSPLRRTARLSTETSGSIEYYLHDIEHNLQTDHTHPIRPRTISTELLEERILRDEENINRLVFIYYLTVFLFIFIASFCNIYV